MSTLAEEAPVENSDALTSALKGHAMLTKEQKAVLSKTLTEFVDSLKDATAVVGEKSWESREAWRDVDWETWETWCWYRHFCRLVRQTVRFPLLQVL